MRVLISRTHHPVTVLGPGNRAGIWFQGCAIRCHGCVSVDTWRADPATVADTDDVLAWLASLPPEEVDGVTISGGEPAEQPEALAAVLRGVAEWRDARRSDLVVPDVLLFSGRDPEWLATGDAAVLAGVDAVVIGPYEAGRAGTSPLRGSDNQRLEPLTPLGRERYADLSSFPRNSVQVQVTDDAMWMVGIPMPGDLTAVVSAVAAQGIDLRGTSWRT